MNNTENLKIGDRVDLPLKAKHFFRTEFTSNCNCAISKAAREFFNHERVSEGVHSLTLFNGNEESDVRFKHDAYDQTMFDIDKEKALEASDPETVIRIIQLKAK